jgi:hypothetical protein
MATLRLIGFAVLVACAASAAAANEKKSAYTKLHLADCREETPDPDDPLASGTWWCAGYDGMPVMVAEGDLRFMVSYGANAADEIAASETLPSFNHIGETLEWRLELGRDDGVWRPFATILRYFTDSDGQKGQFLVITKLGGSGQICQIGFIDALKNPDANILARQVADEAATGFRCGEENRLQYGLAEDDVAEQH